MDTETTGAEVQTQQDTEVEVKPQAKPEVKQTKQEKKVQQAVRKFKLKVNGSEREVDEATAIALAQKGFASDEKFQKTAAKQKRMAQLIAAAKEDPDKFIKQVLGQDAVQFSKKRLARQLEDITLDPKDKELRDLKKKLEGIENEKKKDAETKAAQQQEAAVKHWNEYYDKKLPQAIKASGLPLTEDVIKHATDIMIANLEEGLDLPLEAVMEFTKDRYLGGLKKFFSSIDADRLGDLLGDQVATKLGLSKKKVVAKKPAQSVQDGSQDQAREPKSQQQRMKQFEQRMKRWTSEG